MVSQSRLCVVLLGFALTACAPTPAAPPPDSGAKAARDTAPADAAKAAQALATIRNSVPFPILLPSAEFGFTLVGAYDPAPPRRMPPEWHRVELSFHRADGADLLIQESNGATLEGEPLVVAGHPARYGAGNSVRQLWVDLGSMSFMVQSSALDRAQLTRIADSLAAGWQPPGAPTAPAATGGATPAPPGARAA